MCYGADSFASGDCTGSLSYPFEVAHRMVGGNTIGDAIECVGEQCNLSFVVVEKGSYAITIFNGQWKLGLCGMTTLFFEVLRSVLCEFHKNDGIRHVFVGDEAVAAGWVIIRRCE